MARFSKAAVLAWLERRCEAAAQRFYEAAGVPLDPGNGWAQTEGRGPEAAVCYGEWLACADLAEAVKAGEVAT